MKIHGDLDGMWLSGHVDEAASKENAHPFKGMLHMTYDTAAKGFAMLWVDSTGGWARHSSSGWEVERMVWLGDGSMGGKRVVVQVGPATLTDAARAAASAPAAARASATTYLSDAK